MRKLLLKAINKINEYRYPHIRSDYRACITGNQFSRLREISFYTRDYLYKKPYKEIAYHGEFQQELTFVLPFAYWHYLNGTLKKTVSCRDTGVFYFFSPDHEERFGTREWMGWDYSFDIPNMAHCNTFDYSKWAAVPLKKHFSNTFYRFDKPILIVANKYNTEWSKPPINYLDIPILDRIFKGLKNKYQIIYNRPQTHHIVPDHSEIFNLNEYGWMKEKHPEVLTVQDLFAERPAHVRSYNHLQLMLYANAERFISVHGGTAALASYFGGTNIILSKEGFEHYFREYETLFPKLSNARIIHAIDEKELVDVALGVFHDAGL